MLGVEEKEGRVIICVDVDVDELRSISVSYYREACNEHGELLSEIVRWWGSMSVKPQTPRFVLICLYSL